jgi:hypothetical protein
MGIPVSRISKSSPPAERTSAPVHWYGMRCTLQHNGHLAWGGESGCLAGPDTRLDTMGLLM